MEGEVQILSKQLIEAVEVNMNPYIEHKKRMKAYSLCEQFKETHPLCVQCGIYLAQTQHSEIVRHFGLQLIEHCIKYRWNAMNQTEKVFIKDSTMNLLSNGTLPVLTEPAHIKDGVSRIVVEMMKREWPQQWPTLLTELSELCGKGEVQTELVLLVFLRLIEDVAVLQTLESSQRRKDMYQALTSNMGSIFGLFLDLLQLQHAKYKEKIVSLDPDVKLIAMAHCHVAQGVLVTLASFVERVPIGFIMANNGLLLQVICLLLKDERLQNSAADCLFQVLSRRGKIEDRKPLLILFSEDAMSLIFSAAITASHCSLSEPHYLFLKQLAQVLSGLGTQLCALWGKEEDVKQPPNFSMYLDAMLAFTQHPSLQLTSIANSVWASFFRHEVISQDPVLQSYIPKWVELTAPKVMKVGLPSRTDSPACEYSRLDFESDEEFGLFFNKCRTDILDNFRQVTILSPMVTYAYIERWLTTQINTPITPGAYGSENGLCSLSSPSHLEWDALSSVMDSVLGRLLSTVKPKPSVESGLCTLEMCLNYETNDPLILSTLLSCISALFIFLTMAPDNSMLPRVLNKIFAALVFTLPGQTKESRSRAVKNVRRHGASLLVKISTRYPLLLLSMFDYINETVTSLNNDPTELSKLEKVTVQEALLLISNHFYDYDRQSKFIGQVVQIGTDQWALMERAFKDPSVFMSFVGLDQPPIEPNCNDVNGKNRSQISFCLNLFLAVIKRCSWPDDPDRALKGGFVVGHTESGNPFYRNPSTPHIIPLLPQLFMLVGSFNSLWLPHPISRLSEGYAKAHAMLDIERDNLLGVAKPPIDPLDIPKTQTPLERMQMFLFQVHEGSYQVLGNCGPSLGRDFYQLPNLAQSLLSTVFANIDAVPDYRLRHVVRVFLRPFISSCPSNFYESVLLPLLSSFCPYLFTRLNAKWNSITALYESGSFEEENTDTQEVLDDMLNRQLTREFLDVLKVALIGGSLDDSAINNMTMDHEEQDGIPRATTVQIEAISDLGQLLLRSETTCQSITLFILRALSWQDSNSCLKASLLCGPVVRQLSQDKNLNDDVVHLIMTSVLQGLHCHGQHDGNQGALVALGTQVYEVLRPLYPSVLEIMKEIPNCNLQELQKLDEKVLTATMKGSKIEKAKKDIFRRITNQLILRNVGQMFKKEVHIRELPPLIVQRTYQPDLLQKETQNIGICELFKNDKGSSD